MVLAQVASYSFGSATVYLHDLIILLLVGLSINHVKLKNLTNKLDLQKALVLWVSMAILSLVINRGRFGLNEIGVSSLYLIRWMIYSLLVIAVSYSKFKSSLWLIGLYLTGVAIGLVGLFQFFLYPDLRNLWYLGWDPHYYRLFSTLFDPNFAGIILVLTLFLGFYLAKLNNWWFWLSQSGLLLAIYLTYSRASFLALIIGLITYFISNKMSKLTWQIYIIGIVFFIMVLPKPTGEGGQLFRTASAIARVGNYQRGLELFTKSPIFGWGFNTLRFVSQNQGWTKTDGVPSHAAAGLDNSFLFVSVTTGVVGLASYLWLFIELLKLGLIKNIDQKYKSLYLSSLSAITMHSFFNNTLFYPMVMIWLWILVGVILRIIRDGK